MIPFINNLYSLFYLFHFSVNEDLQEVMRDENLFREIIRYQKILEEKRRREELQRQGTDIGLYYTNPFIV